MSISPLLAAAALSSLVTSSAAATVALLPAQLGGARPVNATYVPGTTIIEDINGDGIADILGVHRSPERFELRLGLGGGAFGLGEPFLMGSVGLSQPALGDVDGDGDRDLVFAENGTEIKLIRRDVSGLLATPELVATTATGTMERLELGDLDGDGDLDLVGARNQGTALAQEIVVFFNDGSGSFSAPLLALSVPGAGSRFFRLGHFDGNAWADLAIEFETSQFNPSARLQVALGDGTGLFGTPTELTPLERRYSGNTAIDVDGDGRDEIVSARGGMTREVFVYDRQLNGTWTVSPALGAYPGLEDLSVSDMDQDGDLDVLVAAGTGLQLLEADAPGSFLPSVPAGGMGELDFVSLTVGDLNGDGTLDVFGALGEVQRRGLGFALGRGPGSALLLGEQEGLSFVDFRGHGIATGDLDGNGVPEILSVMFASPATLARYEPVGEQGYRAQVAPLGLENVVDLRVIDPDGDGQQDLLLGTGFGLLHLGRNLGGGELSISPIAGSFSSPESLTIADLDGDGDEDVIVVERTGNSVVWHEAVAGAGLMPAATLIQADDFVSIAVLDLDNDGRNDLVRSTGFVAASNEMGLFWSRNLGGTFAPWVFVSTLRGAQAIVAGDLNGDSLTDVVGFVPGSTYFMENLGGGAMADGVALFNTALDSDEILLTDLELDGDLDLVVGGSQGQLRIGFNDGAGGFGTVFDPGVSSSSLALADMDGDADVDLLVAGSILGVPDVNLFEFRSLAAGSVGSSLCGPAVANSSGGPALMDAVGSDLVLANALRLRASSLPQDSFGYFLVSQTSSVTFPVANSVGRLCLGGAIGRYSRPDQIQSSGSGGTFDLRVDLTEIPSPTGAVIGLPGQRWYGQAWFRDSDPSGAATSNFSDAVEIVLN